MPVSLCYPPTLPKTQNGVLVSTMALKIWSNRQDWRKSISNTPSKFTFAILESIARGVDFSSGDTRWTDWIDRREFQLCTGSLAKAFLGGCSRGYSFCRQKHKIDCTVCFETEIQVLNFVQSFAAHKINYRLIDTYFMNRKITVETGEGQNFPRVYCWINEYKL